MRIELKATSATAARREAKGMFPGKEKRLTGYNREGEKVYFALVREKGNKVTTATARKGDEVAVRFEAEVVTPVWSKIYTREGMTSLD